LLNQLEPTIRPDIHTAQTVTDRNPTMHRLALNWVTESKQQVPTIYQQMWEGKYICRHAIDTFKRMNNYHWIDWNKI